MPKKLKTITAEELAQMGFRLEEHPNEQAAPDNGERPIVAIRGEKYDELKDDFRGAAYERAVEQGDCPLVSAIQLATEGVRLMLSWSPENGPQLIKAIMESREVQAAIEDEAGRREAAETALVSLEEIAQRVHDDAHEAQREPENGMGLGEAFAEALANALAGAFPDHEVEVVDAKKRSSKAIH